MRVVMSNIQNLDIPEEQAESFGEAIHRALAQPALYETYKVDRDQRIAEIRLFPYTDPQGLDHWAVYQDNGTETDCQDIDDLDEAISFYEIEVYDLSTEEGPEPQWDYTDVAGVSARTVGEPDVFNARLIEANWADLKFSALQFAYAEAARRRQRAYARAVDAYGDRGGLTFLARKVGRSEPTVKSIADRGRALIAEEFSVDAFEDSSGMVYVQHVETLWRADRKTAERRGKFAEDMRSWRDGDWKGPNTDSGWIPFGSSPDLTHIASWSSADGLEVITDADGPVAGSMGRGYLGV